MFNDGSVLLVADAIIGVRFVVKDDIAVFLTLRTVFLGGTNRTRHFCSGMFCVILNPFFIVAIHCYLL